jgi:SAM-dependent methyltransferase
MVASGSIRASRQEEGAQVASDKTEPFRPEHPWSVSDTKDCFFYHSIDLPDGTALHGHWDIRGRFDEYVGRYPLAGKTVLDVGTATGFLAFSAEAAGAQVTALDVRTADELRRIPFENSLYHVNRTKWIADCNAMHLEGLKRAFWYTWHKLNSKVEVIYAPLDSLFAWDRKFDVVLAGAIIEHISDPVSAIGTFAWLAKDAVIISFTEVVDTEEWTMQTMGDWSNPDFDFEWWKLSRGLYRRVFDNLGFDVEFVKSTAVYNPGAPKEATRPTIIARRRPPGATAIPPSRQPVAQPRMRLRSKIRSALSRLKTLRR